MNLYELTGQYKELTTLEDMDPQAISDTLEALEGEISEKAQAIVAVRAGMESDITAIDTEIKRLQKRKEVIQNRDQSVRDYLKSNMQASGIRNIKCPYFSITLAKGRDMVEITDEGEIPDQYVSVETTVKPDKKTILTDLKNGIDVPGARLIKSDESLRIK